MWSSSRGRSLERGGRELGAGSGGRKEHSQAPGGRRDWRELGAGSGGSKEHSQAPGGRRRGGGREQSVDREREEVSFIKEERKEWSSSAKEERDRRGGSRRSEGGRSRERTGESFNCSECGRSHASRDCSVVRKREEERGDLRGQIRGDKKRRREEETERNIRFRPSNDERVVVQSDILEKRGVVEYRKLPAELIKKLSDTPKEVLEGRLYSRHPGAGHKVLDHLGSQLCMRFTAASKQELGSYVEEMFDICLEEHSKVFIDLLVGQNEMKAEDKAAMEENMKKKVQRLAEINMKSLEYFEHKLGQIENEKSETEKKLSSVKKELDKTENETRNYLKRIIQLELSVKNSDRDKIKSESEYKILEKMLNQREKELGIATELIQTDEKLLKTKTEDLNLVRTELTILKECYEKLKADSKLYKEEAEKGAEILKIRNKERYQLVEVEVLKERNKGKESLEKIKQEVIQLRIQVASCSTGVQSKVEESLNQEVVHLKSYLELKDNEILNKTKEIKLKNQEIAFLKSRDSLMSTATGENKECQEQEKSNPVLHLKDQAGAIEEVMKIKQEPSFDVDSIQIESCDALEDSFSNVTVTKVEPSNVDKVIEQVITDSVMKVMEEESMVQDRKDDGEVQNEAKARDDGKFQCEECARVFARKSYLVNHMKVHSSARPFACIFCETTFKRKPGLDKHEKICIHGMLFN